MLKPEEYIETLRDGRRVFYKGERIADVTANPELRVGIDLGASDYAMAADPKYRDVCVAQDEMSGKDINAFYKIPRSADDVMARSRLIELGTEHGHTIPPLIKEIGTDALFALLRVVEGEALEKARDLYRHCAEGDLAVAVAQTDVKGDRSKAPHAQPDPDHYLHVVSQDDAGITVRGAKAHTSASVNSHEVIVLPTRAMGPDDADWAISFAVPIDTEGLNLYVSPYSGSPANEFENPASYRTKMLETLTVFDDVFVPWERVFLFKEPALTGPLALGFVEYHRFTAVSYKLPLLDALVGAAGTIAEMNGVMKAGHIRDKLTMLIAYGENVRALTEMAAIRATEGPNGIWVPDPMTTNLAKYTFATGYHEALALVQECAGGLLVTGPGKADWENPEIRPVLEKYLSAVAGAEERLRMMNLITDLTTGPFGGYHAVLAIHAEGSVEAEKMQIFRSYDARKAFGIARKLAGIN